MSSIKTELSTVFPHHALPETFKKDSGAVFQVRYLSFFRSQDPVPL